MATKKDRNRRTPSQARAEVVSMQAAMRSGPLPPPSELAQYDAIVPGMAERLLTKFEQQADHRMRLESHVIRWDVIRANAGLIAGFVFGLAVLAVAALLILNGYEGIGTTIVIVEFLVYGGAFLYSNESRRRERNTNR